MDCVKNTALKNKNDLPYAVISIRSASVRKPQLLSTIDRSGRYDFMRNLELSGGYSENIDGLQQTKSAIRKMKKSSKL